MSETAEIVPSPHMSESLLREILIQKHDVYGQKYIREHKGRPVPDVYIITPTMKSTTMYSMMKRLPTHAWSMGSQLFDSSMGIRASYVLKAQIISDFFASLTIDDIVHDLRQFTAVNTAMYGNQTDKDNMTEYVKFLRTQVVCMINTAMMRMSNYCDMVDSAYHYALTMYAILGCVPCEWFAASDPRASPHIDFTDCSYDNHYAEKEHVWRWEQRLMTVLSNVAKHTTVKATIPSFNELVMTYSTSEGVKCTRYDNNTDAVDDTTLLDVYTFGNEEPPILVMHNTVCIDSIAEVMLPAELRFHELSMLRHAAVAYQLDGPIAFFQRVHQPSTTPKSSHDGSRGASKHTFLSNSTKQELAYMKRMLDVENTTSTRSLLTTLKSVMNTDNEDDIERLETRLTSDLLLGASGDPTLAAGMGGIPPSPEDLAAMIANEDDTFGTLRHKIGTTPMPTMATYGQESSRGKVRDEILSCRMKLMKANQKYNKMKGIADTMSGMLSRNVETKRVLLRKHLQDNERIEQLEEDIQSRQRAADDLSKQHEKMQQKMTRLEYIIARVTAAHKENLKQSKEVEMKALQSVMRPSYSAKRPMPRCIDISARLQNDLPKLASDYDNILEHKYVAGHFAVPQQQGKEELAEIRKMWASELTARFYLLRDKYTANGNHMTPQMSAMSADRFVNHFFRHFTDLEITTGIPFTSDVAEYTDITLHLWEREEGKYLNKTLVY